MIRKWICFSLLIAAALFTPVVVGHSSTMTRSELADGVSPPPPPPWPKTTATAVYRS
jgi:hypothetical protein